MFNQLSDYIKDRVESYIRIEHVGSTSIPGMDAKPIIDLVIEVSPFDFNNIKIELENIGYIHNGDQGIDGREVFNRLGNNKSILDVISHHLYVCESNNSEYLRLILFRDRLRTHRLLREEYMTIKYEILEKVGSTNRKGYVEMKENNYRDFFSKVLG